MSINMAKLIVALLLCSPLAVSSSALATEIGTSDNTGVSDALIGIDSSETDDSRFGSWRISHFVDEFDQETDVQYISVTSDNGYYSTTLVTRNKLRAVVIFEPVEASSSWYMEVKLFANSRTQIYGGAQDRTYKATILDGQGEKHYYTATLSANADRVVFDISDSHEIMQLLLAGGSLSVRLDDKANARNIYLFTIDNCSGFSEAIEKYVSDNGQLPDATFTSENAPVNDGRTDSRLLSDAQVGETVLFGTYNQDGDAGDAPKPIEWVVLRKDGDKMLLLSKFALECMPFNATQGEVTWETSSLREWLNGEFYRTAFSQEEQGEILETSLVTAENIYFGTGGCETADKVFLLSFEEIDAFLTTDQSRICLPTVKALESGAYVGMNGAADWWLRTSGSLDETAAHVNPIGVTALGGYYVSSSGYGVRPAIWIGR